MKIEHKNSKIVEIIRDYINSNSEKKITFAEYMNLALYHPEYGYYSSGTVDIGKDGDFFTASSLGADFCELLAEQLVNCWEVMGKPSAFSLVEMGAGLGFLARDILRYLQLNYSQFYEVFNYLIIEKSPFLINKQRENLQEFINKINWQSLDKLNDNSLVGCCFSNELIDAFPVHKVTLQNGELKEIFVTLSEGQFKEIICDLSTEKLREYFSLNGVNITNNDYPEGYQTEVNLAALEWLKILNDKLKKGYIITIDYGYSANKFYHPQRYQGTLKCYYQHRHHDNPYLNIGCQDITSHVDFTALQNYAKNLGLINIGYTQQAMFLMSLGLGDRLNQLSNNTYNIQEIFSRRDSLHQLIDPTGLGGFGVLIQGKNIPENVVLKGLNFTF